MSLRQKFFTLFIPIDCVVNPGKIIAGFHLGPQKLRPKYHLCDERASNFPELQNQFLYIFWVSFAWLNPAI